MRVLVLGATGFIGYPVSHALVRSGYIVLGQTRSESKAKTLAAEEITPIVGEPTSQACLSHIPKVDVVIDCLAINDPVAPASGVEAYLEAAKSARPIGAPKLTYIYSSGAWVHGHSREFTVTDSTPVTDPVELVKWRPQVEQTVVTAQEWNGIVVRPSMLYGRSGSICGLVLFSEVLAAKAENRPPTLAGTPGGSFPVIHQDDLADLYVRVAERGPVLKGLIFDASNDYMEPTDIILERLARIAGAKPFEYREPRNLFEAAVATTAVIRPYLARSLVGWVPRKPGLIDGLDTYWTAYLASRGTQISQYSWVEELR